MPYEQLGADIVSKVEGGRQTPAVDFEVVG